MQIQSGLGIVVKLPFLLGLPHALFPCQSLFGWGARTTEQSCRDIAETHECEQPGRSINCDSIHVSLAVANLRNQLLYHRQAEDADVDVVYSSAEVIEQEAHVAMNDLGLGLDGQDDEA